MDVVDELRDLGPELVKQFPAIRVLYLFGSQASGQAKGKSDADIGIMLDEHAYLENPLLDLEIGLFVEKRLRRLVDVVVLNRASPILQHQVIARGVRLYEADAEQRARFELIAFKRYVDARHYQEKRFRAAII
jgi:uncharacterized protein